MATTITVPSGSGGASVSLTFATANSASLATSLLAAVYSAGTSLFVGTGTIAASTVAGAVNEYLIPAGTSAVTIPAGYNYVVDAATGPVTIDGNSGTSEKFVATSSSPTVSGFLLENFGSGSVVAGSGTDTIVSTGSNASVYVFGDGTTTTLLPSNGASFNATPGAIGVLSGSGSVGGSGGLVFGNGTNALITNSGTATTIVAGAGVTTIAASAGGGLYFDFLGNLTVLSSGATSVVAGGSVTATGGTGTSAYFVAGNTSLSNAAGGSAYVIQTGAGVASVTNGSGGVVQLFGTSSGNELFAGAGAETVAAPFATGANSIFGGSGTDLVYLGLTGSDTFYAGSGSASVLGGATDTYAFIAGSTGGASSGDTIFNFTGADKVAISGYGTAAGAAALAGGSSVSGGGTVGYQFTLPDKTTVLLVGITTAPTSQTTIT